MCESDDWLADVVVEPGLCVLLTGKLTVNFVIFAPATGISRTDAA